MPSITYWSQLQPSPRAPSIAESLAARVRDPAWLLGRQWQLGEFEGADAGSVAFARIASHVAPLSAAQAGAVTIPLAGGQLLEPALLDEPLHADLPTRVELGQTFEQLLAELGGTTQARDQVRAAFPIAPAAASAGEAEARFLRVCAGRAADGAALYAAARNAPNHLPPGVDAGAQPALAAFVAWVEATWRGVGDADPAAWDASHLGYDVSVQAQAPGGAGYTLAGQPDSQADLDWYAFDLTASTPAPPAASTAVSVMPGHVRFRGMPSARWWDFEGRKTDFGALTPDTRDLAKLLFMDFMLLHGDDWYLAPLEVPAGSLSFLDSLTVRDVFGVEAAVPRAGAPGWALFSTTDVPHRGLAPFLVVPATASAALSAGAPVEEVHLLRDETADMAWAVEHIVEGPTGETRLEPPPPPPAPLTGAPAPLAYQLATPLPPAWFPLLPVASGGTVALVAGTVEGGAAPVSRVVTRLRAPGFQLPDREVPRAGIRMQRAVCRSRSADGKMHLWLARRKLVGAGEASSGLRYDQAVEVP
jgi:hypothetical protein